jgi:hypothetical protein
MYIRDNEWLPIGAVVITVDRKHRQVNYNLSMVNPVDAIDLSTGRRRPFDSRRARLMALERLVEKPVSAPIKTGATMHDITCAVMKHLATNKNAPSRAVKFAKMWNREMEYWF